MNNIQGITGNSPLYTALLPSENKTDLGIASKVRGVKNTDADFWIAAKESYMRERTALKNAGYIRESNDDTKESRLDMNSDFWKKAEAQYKKDLPALKKAGYVKE